MVLEARAVSRATPIVTSRGATWRRKLLPHNVRRQGTLRSWRATHNFDIGVLKTFQNNHTTIKHIYN